jgi:hypothetical protein
MISDRAVETERISCSCLHSDSWSNFQDWILVHDNNNLILLRRDWREPTYSPTTSSKDYYEVLYAVCSRWYRRRQSNIFVWTFFPEPRSQREDGWKLFEYCSSLLYDFLVLRGGGVLPRCRPWTLENSSPAPSYLKTKYVWPHSRPRLNNYRPVS